MEDETRFRTGPIPEKYLDLRPHDTYEENIDTLDAIIDGEYEVIGETYGDLHPRVFHKAFSEFYGQETGSAKVDEQALEEMQEILSENSDTEYFWPEEKLFNLGYRLGPRNRRRGFMEKKRERESPDIAHGRDIVKDMDVPMPDNPVRNGRKKREGDEYYMRTSERIGLDTAGLDLELV